MTRTKEVDDYMNELIDLLERLKGMESLISTFYKHNIENPDCKTLEDTEAYIRTLRTVSSCLSNRVCIFPASTPSNIGKQVKR